MCTCKNLQVQLQVQIQVKLQVQLQGPEEHALYLIFTCFKVKLINIQKIVSHNFFEPVLLSMTSLQRGSSILHITKVKISTGIVFPMLKNLRV